MPSYFYHLKFELYPTSSPAADRSLPPVPADDIWLPPLDASIFDELPSHPQPLGRPQFILPQAPSYQQQPLRARARGWSSSAGETSASAASLDVIDCGAPRPREETARKIERLSERQLLERTRSYPPPPSTAAIRPQTAVRDWRFGRVSVETVEPAAGTDDMAGETSKAVSPAAPTLGPTYGGAGTATRAEVLPLKTKNTELGWGVVHFYRDGEENPGLQALELEDHENEEPEQEEDTNLDDYTTLCIAAVPAYMSPGDILGFLGERWREDISHCRMVMTSRMNRYLVLLRFRDGKRAKQWRHEFDGKVFNTMEVGHKFCFGRHPTDTA